MPQVYLTDTLVSDAVCAPSRKQEIFWDHSISADGQLRNGSVAGLGLRVSALGHKSFVHDYQYKGRRRRTVLGPTTIFTVGSARVAVKNRERLISMGQNPDADNIDPVPDADMTVREAIDRYWESHVIKLTPGSRRSFGIFVARWHRHVPRVESRRGQNTRKNHADFGHVFADRPLRSIRPQDIENNLKQYTSAYSHNHALRLVLALFNWAIRMQLVDMRNPCGPIRPRKIVRRRRHYNLEQIKIIADHIFNPDIPALPETVELSGQAKKYGALAKGRAASSNQQMAELRNFMGILFLTMARPGDLITARFEHFDLEALVWHKHNTKGIKLSRATAEWAYRSVPIHPRVAEMVRAQQARWPESGLVFPSHSDSARPRCDFGTSLTRFKSLPGVPEHFQLYDLKRIAISLMLTGQGVSREAVSHYVDHRGNITTTMIYDLGLVDPLRPVADKLGDLLGA